MEENEYWINYWKNNDIVNKSGLHEKVGRTIAGKPITNEKWSDVLSDLETQLTLNSKDDLLDIAAGSGAISIPFSNKVHSVIAIDISEKLLSGMEGINGIKTMAADIRTTDFEENQFSKIILYFALQHFTEKETVILFQKIHKWLKPNGFCYIGDIPDEEKKFDFFNSKEREVAYFNSIVKSQPIIGTWFMKDFLKKLGKYSGFKETSIIAQPEDYINAHYRFDVKLVK